MNEELNNIEIALIEAIVDENKMNLPFLVDHLDLIYVKKRENTGVGIYIDFGYRTYQESKNVNTLISSNKTLKIKGLSNEVTYVLFISNGRINFLELVTNGNEELIKDKFDYEFQLF